RQTGFAIQRDLTHPTQLIAREQYGITCKKTKTAVRRRYPNLTGDDADQRRPLEHQLPAVMSFLFTGYENFGDFHSAIYNKFNRIRLSAVASIASGIERGDQPSKRIALALVVFIGIPSKGTMLLTIGSFSAATRNSVFGNCFAFTFSAAVPRFSLSILATSTSQMLSPPVAIKRSP